MHVRATNWALFTEIYMALTLIYSKDELLTLVYKFINTPWLKP